MKNVVTISREPGKQIKRKLQIYAVFSFQKNGSCFCYYFFFQLQKHSHEGVL